MTSHDAWSRPVNPSGRSSWLRTAVYVTAAFALLALCWPATAQETPAQEAPAQVIRPEDNGLPGVTSDDQAPEPSTDRQELQKIVSDPMSSAAERMKAIELKARLDGKIGHGKGEQPGSTMTRTDLELFVSDLMAEREQRKHLAGME